MTHTFEPEKKWKSFERTLNYTNNFAEYTRYCTGCDGIMSSVTILMRSKNTTRTDKEIWECLVGIAKDSVLQ